MEIKLRPISELDIEPVSAIDEKITGRYHPEEWESRFAFYLRRDPELSLVAEMDGKVVGFMLGDVRSGEFGLHEPAGWIEVLGVDPAAQGHSIGRMLLDGMIANFRERKVHAVRTLVDEKSQEQLLGFFEKAQFERTPIQTLECKL